MAYEDYEGEIGEVGYDVVGAIQNVARARGINLPAQQAQQIAQVALAGRRPLLAAQNMPRPVYPRPIVQGRLTGMTTGLPLGAGTYAAAAAAGAQVILAQVCQERMVARRLIMQRYNQWVPAAATPLPGCQGLGVSVMDVRVGQRSVLAGGAGLPIETFAPGATGGALLAGGVEINEGKTVTVVTQLINGPVPAAEAINVSGYLSGEE